MVRGGGPHMKKKFSYLDGELGFSETSKNSNILRSLNVQKTIYIYIYIYVCVCVCVTPFYVSFIVIPRLTKILRSGITFVSRNTHTDGKDKLLEWPDRSCLLLYVSARNH